MKQPKFLSLLSMMLILGVCSLNSCKKGGGDSGGQVLEITVVDENDHPVVNATVTCGDVSSSSSSAGIAILEGVKAEDGKFKITVTSENYFPGYRNVVKVDDKKHLTVVKLIAKQQLGTVNATANTTLNGSGHRLMLNGGGFKDEAGNAVSGTITVYSRYIGADDMNLLSTTMPGGDFNATNQSGVEGVLESYGFTAFEFRDANNNQVYPNTNSAQVAITVSQQVINQINNTGGAQVWLFNTESASWSYGGNVTINGNEIFMPVTSSTFGNCDHMNAKATVKGHFTCDSETEPAPGEIVVLRGAYGYAMEYTTYTNINGNFQIEVGVPSSGGQYTVISGNYQNTINVSAGQINDIGNIDVCAAFEGSEGDPRFNLQFSNGQNVDLDIHVITPNGNEIYYGNTSADGGTLDVDCICGSCGAVGNENVYWPVGGGLSGNYEFWVEYYSDCEGTGNASSTYTLRLIKNGEVKATYTGTLSAEGQASQHYTYTHQ